MEPKPADVKQRPYDSSRRQRNAQTTRAHILTVARRRFLANGYTATTIAMIAHDADVSVDAIFKAYGGKPGLVRAIHAQSLAGDQAVAAETRSDTLQLTEPDPHRVMRGIGRLTAEVAPNVAPIMLLIRDAALTDPDMSVLKHDLDQQRLERMTHNARTLSAAGHLRPDITIDEAAETMWTYTAPELYELVVIRRDWTPQRFGDFVADALTSHLLDPERSRRSPAE